jgi:hypothetical protein
MMVILLLNIVSPVFPPFNSSEHGTFSVSENQAEFAEEIKSHHLKFLNCTAEQNCSKYPFMSLDSLCLSLLIYVSSCYG